MPPAKKLAFVVCMDARIDPIAAFGLKEGDAHVIRNAGGRVVEAVRSLVISQELLGTREIVVVHHTYVPSIYLLVCIMEVSWSVGCEGWRRRRTILNDSTPGYHSH